MGLQIQEFNFYITAIEGPASLRLKIRDSGMAVLLTGKESLLITPKVLQKRKIICLHILVSLATPKNLPGFYSLPIMLMTFPEVPD